MTLITETRKRCPELGEFLEYCCKAPLSFDGPYPMMHSSNNHIHLWALEWWADHHQWIDLDYRIDFVAEIFAHWRGRVKGLLPYREDGYLVYLYEDMAPTVSIVASTPEGCPYGREHTFVGSTGEVLAPYVNQSWQDNFEFVPWEVDQDRILKVIEKNAGSIGKPSAEALGVKVGHLRTLIEQMGLEEQVNALRKRYKRRPANFREEEFSDMPRRMYEVHWPAGY